MSGLDSKLISVVSETSLLNDLLARASSFINSSYAKHASHLTSGDADSLSLLIEKTLQSELDQTKSYQLFTPDLVNLMDVNAEKYILILIVKTETEDTRSSKLDAFRCVSHLHTYLRNVTWGHFQVKILDAEFKKLSDTMDSLLWEQIYKLLDFISKLSDSVTTSGSDASKSASESIDKLSDQLFERLVNDLPNEVRPNLKITTVIYKLADEYLSVVQKSNNLDIFLKSKVKENFIKIKNSGFRKS
ncbi:hypothetical protein Cantr_05777 [Candida viswanathii]|uniref:Uncharacterized protein n=1 Tax=Candida viswanathii TaxID=5486 RepID=A0A367XSL0_9ASCO|nr:hypothetical protein Cantr_05777 [Candida viswanathii]